MYPRIPTFLPLRSPFVRESCQASKALHQLGEQDEEKRLNPGEQMLSVSRLLWSHANTRGVLRVQDPVPCEPQVKAIAAARCSELYAILTYSRCSLSPWRPNLRGHGLVCTADILRAKASLGKKGQAGAKTTTEFSAFFLEEAFAPPLPPSSPPPGAHRLGIKTHHRARQRDLFSALAGANSQTLSEDRFGLASELVLFASGKHKTLLLVLLVSC